MNTQKIDALAELIYQHSPMSREHSKHLAEVLYTAGYRKQSENFVEVVRCKECEYHHWEQEPCHGKTIHKCSVLDAEVFRDFYCYYGKPKMKCGAE